MGKPGYYLSPEGAFVIENYNSTPTFSSFFPGIAGQYGCPLWVFYANRGQCIASAGVFDKNGALLEFQPANKAYRTTALNGFRTFIKVNGQFYEPFSERSPYQNEMHIFPDSLTIIENNPDLKIRVEVTYFTIPNEFFPALGRRLKITNLAKKSKKLEVIDGLPIIIPCGFSNDLLKKISRTIEAWCCVSNVESTPFYRLKVLPSDTTETSRINEGNFYFAFAGGKKDLSLKVIVNPKTVFGEVSSMEYPEVFLNATNYVFPKKQLCEGFTPSAMAYHQATLKDETLIFSVIGKADSLEELKTIRARVNSRYLDAKFLENKTLIDDLCSAVNTRSASQGFDLYVRNTFLDNVMRGGLPVHIGGKPIYLYYRKHGDMERDYNDFQLMPTSFSQGSGNYRDINQNRRNDVFVNPALGSDNIVHFINLIQLDGFNPLVVLADKYFVSSEDAAHLLLAKHFKKPDEGFVSKLTTPFLLGYLLKDIFLAGLQLKTSLSEFTADLLHQAEVEEAAEHGEGFWIDHFSYNLDLLESFGCVFPEKVEALLYQQKIFTFFDNAHVVAPRREKYKIVGQHLRQSESVRLDREKESLLNSRLRKKNTVRAAHGQGEIYYTTLLDNLLCLTANKAASFDAAGIGLEMEADKPDWYDALNGLPGLLGSSLNETLELQRLASYLLAHLLPQKTIRLPVELKDFINELAPVLDDWDQSCSAKEAFRAKTKFGLAGEEGAMTAEELTTFLKNVVEKCQAGVDQARKKYGTYCTYFINEAVDFENVDGEIKIKKFIQHPLPLFLEGFVHALKVRKDRSIYQSVLKSSLYDKKLKMYKVNSPLNNAPLEIGRSKVFTPGWLENESVWMHMEYKYMLELLKAGLHREFFANFKKVIVPFMDPKIYKRSILENSSFIVSSANPNCSNHGRGFVARLSGCAAEFIDIWLIMMSGKKIFYFDAKLNFRFRLAPVLPAWLFKNGRLSFTLLGSIEVEYVNKKRKNTFGPGGVAPIAYRLTIEGQEEEIEGSSLPESYALLIRERKVQKITVTLG